MAIQRLPSKADDTDIRAFQARMTEVGRIRLGQFNPEGRGRPEKLDRFRLTSSDERLIRLVAEVYGGEAREYTPQRRTVVEWEVVTDVSEMPVYVPRQTIEPWNEAWRPGTCIRRCDGVFEKIKQEPCVCNGPRPPADRDLCKPTIQVQLLRPEIPGLGTWRLVSKGENACRELSAPAPFIARTLVPVPAMLILRKEARRPWNEEKQKFDTLDFYVPWLHISAATPAQFAVGGDVLTQALIAGGAPIALAAPGARMALEAAPVADDAPSSSNATRPGAVQTPEPNPLAPSVAPVHQSPPEVHPAPPTATEATTPEAASPTAHPERAQILAAIEQKASMADMEVLRDKLKARGVTDQTIRDAWRSRYNSIQAAVEAAGKSEPADHQGSLKAAQQRAAAGVREIYDQLPDGPPSVGDTVTVAGMESTKVGEDPFGPGGSDIPPPAGPETVDAELVEPTADDFTAQREQLLGAGATFDVNEEFGMLYAAAGPLDWTTAQTNEKIRAFCKVEKVSEATGDALHAMRMAIKNGQLR